MGFASGKGHYGLPGCAVVEGRLSVNLFFVALGMFRPIAWGMGMKRQHSEYGQTNLVKEDGKSTVVPALWRLMYRLPLGSIRRGLLQRGRTGWSVPTELYFL